MIGGLLVVSSLVVLYYLKAPWWCRECCVVLCLIRGLLASLFFVDNARER